MPKIDHVQKGANKGSWFLTKGGNQLLGNRTLLAISFAVFIVYIGLGMTNTVRVLYAQSRGASLSIISLMASTYLISTFVFQYPVSLLATHWGRKPVLIGSLVIQAFLSGIYLFVTDPLLFVALRFFEGVAAAAVVPIARAVIADTVLVEQRGQAYGLFTAFFNAGFLLGPGLGGVLASRGYASVFVVAIFVRLIAVFVVLVLIDLRGQGNRVVASSVIRGSYRALWRRPLIGVYLIAFGNYLYLGFELTLMPLWMLDHLGASITMIGLAYMTWSIPLILLAPFGGRLADRWHGSWIILLFGIAQVPIYIAYGLANVALAVVGLYALHGTLYAFLQPALDTQVASLSQGTTRTQIQGMYATASSVGAFVGASLFTPLYLISFRLPLFAMGGVYGILLFIGWMLIHLWDGPRV